MLPPIHTKYIGRPLHLLNTLIVFLGGVGLALAYEKRKTLLSPIFVHIMKNAMFMVPILFLALQNFYIPAKTWSEAKIKPKWLKSNPPKQIERQNNGSEQWQYAIDTWGSKGSKKWKMEVNAFEAVCFWFPEDETSCAKARLSIGTVYSGYLMDQRRAIIEVDKLLSQYPDEKEQIAQALCVKGWAYYMLKDFKCSKECFDKVIDEFKEYDYSYESAKQGIKWLNDLGYE